jgi:putative pyruvate formate lyase activating enzyme
MSLMSQYFPLYKASEYPEINREVSRAEFEKAYDYLLDAGFDNGWIQEGDSTKKFVPDFTSPTPFDMPEKKTH